MPDNGGADWADMSALVAHGLLNTVAKIVLAASTIREDLDRLSRKRCDELLELIERLGFDAGETIGELARGIPPEVIAELHALRPSSRGVVGPIPRLRQRREDHVRDAELEALRSQVVLLRAALNEIGVEAMNRGEELAALDLRG